MYLSEDEFSETLTRLLDLRREKRAWLLIGLGGVNFTFLPGAADRTLQERSDEVEEAIQAAILGQSPETYARRGQAPLRRLTGTEEEEEDVEVARAKLALIGEKLDLEALRRRYWLKRTSKTAVPATVEWDVATKAAEDTITVPGDEPVAFAVLRLVGQRRVPNDGSTEVVLTLDDEDVGYLLGRLESLRDALLGLEGQHG